MIQHGLFQPSALPGKPIVPAAQRSARVTLRPYQLDAINGVEATLADNTSALVVMPTGTGKTVTFCELAHNVIKSSGKRVLICAHRNELINQTAAAVTKVTGLHCCVEMAERWADDFDPSPVVVASIPTLVAGNPPRMERFQPDHFAMVIIDEAHHAAASSYRRVIQHFTHEHINVVGVTATPDRADEKALGQIFDAVAYSYEITDAIRDGWLVPIEQNSVAVEGLDFGAIRTTAGDLNQGDLESVMAAEKVLHAVTRPTFEIAAGRKTLVFATSLVHAERMTEIFNRYEFDCARWVHGGTPKQEREQLFKDYKTGSFSILVNVGVATEGFDEPGIQVVSIARPTKSRALYAQMIGRGTRPLPGLVDGVAVDTLRRQAISASGKPKCEVLDFVGNSGRHKLVSVADILGGDYDDEVVEQVTRNVRETADGHPVDVAAELERTRQRIEEKKKRDAERRRNIVGRAKYSKVSVDPFDVFDVRRPKEKGWDEGRTVSPKMAAILERNGIDPNGLNFTEAKRIVSEIFKRWDGKLATFKQCKALSRFGINGAEMTKQEASDALDTCFRR